MVNTAEKRKDADEGNMYPSKWTEGYFFCIDPYGSTVESNSTTHSVVLGRMSSSNRHITFQCFLIVFAEFLLPSGCFWTLKITVSRKFNLDQIAGTHKNNLDWKVWMGQLYPASVKKISLFKGVQYLETLYNKACFLTVCMWCNWKHRSLWKRSTLTIAHCNACYFHAFILLQRFSDGR